MRGIIEAVLALLLAASLSSAAAAEMWATGYYPGWRQRHLPPEKIDYSALTHLVHFAVVPRPDGSLDSSVNLLTPANRAAATSAAHAAGRKILFAVGGQATRERFLGAMAEKNRGVFIMNLVRFLRENDYDGIDVDMEEIKPQDAQIYAAFITSLRRELDALSPRPLLTAPVLWEAPQFARLARHFDQINIMSYNISGPYPGWVAWHSGPLFNGGGRFPNGKTALPSLDGLVESFLEAGVPREKLGVGMSFIGYVWTGGEVSRPRQGWTTAPNIKILPYFDLAAAYGIEEDGPESPNYRWDDQAQAAYLSIEGPQARERQFVSYGNEVSIRKTVDYARERGLGGMIIWDIAAGYRLDRPEGRRDPLLQAVKKARAVAEGMP